MTEAQLDELVERFNLDVGIRSLPTTNLEVRRSPVSACVCVCVCVCVGRA